MTNNPPIPFVSRGGPKLRHALDHFKFNVTGLRCADFGCSTGGFTDCLLKAGAAAVTSIDTGYGVLAWTLRKDPRVTLMERTNAVHSYPPDNTPCMDLIVIDMGWTPQRLCIPAALRWLKAGGRIITLIKPHYELDAAEKSRDLKRGVLADDVAEAVARRVADSMPTLGARVLGLTPSPVRGSGASAEGQGNMEWLAMVEREPQ